MGMFNTIVADIPCPETGKLSKDTEIQIKWQDRDARVLDVYRTGDSLPDLLSKYNNTWVRTDYICNACSHKTTGYTRLSGQGRFRPDTFYCFKGTYCGPPFPPWRM